MVTIIGHLAAGLVIARVVHNPAVAVVAGVASHAAMDYALPEYRGWPPARHWPWWLWQAVGSIVLLSRGWPWALWGIAGVMLPDLLDGAYSLLQPQAWQRGQLLCRWHRAGTEWTKRDMGWASTILMEALLIWWGCWGE